jgi:hypothetical protein
MTTFIGRVSEEIHKISSSVFSKSWDGAGIEVCLGVCKITI